MKNWAIINVNIQSNQSALEIKFLEKNMAESMNIFQRNKYYYKRKLFNYDKDR